MLGSTALGILGPPWKGVGNALESFGAPGEVLELGSASRSFGNALEGLRAALPGLREFGEALNTYWNGLRDVLGSGRALREVLGPLQKALGTPWGGIRDALRRIVALLRNFQKW